MVGKRDPSSPSGVDSSDDHHCVILPRWKVEGASHPPARLVIVYGPELGRRYDVAERPLTIGRDSTSDICLDQDSISRTHAIITVDANGVRIRDNDSTNGTYIGDNRINEAPLKHGDFVKVGRSILLFITGDDIPSAFFGLLTTDNLTGVHNKRYFTDVLEQELSRTRHRDRPLVLVIIEIDHLERFDDEPKHRTRDFAVRSVAALIRDCTREVDEIARTADAQFSIIVSERSLDQGVELAETIRKAIEQAHLEFEGHPVQLTVSMGVAKLEPNTADADALVQIASARALRAKSLGCNRVVSSDRQADEG